MCPLTTRFCLRVVQNITLTLCIFEQQATHRFQMFLLRAFSSVLLLMQNRNRIEAGLSLVCGKVRRCRVAPVLVCHFTDTNGTAYTRNTFSSKIVCTSALPSKIDCTSMCDPAKGPRLVLFADTHGLTGYEPNLTNNPIWNLDGKSTLSGAQVGHGPITSNPPWRSAQNFAEETPGICWQSNMFTGESKAETLGTFNKLATKEQLKNTSRQLVMKFTLLQLYGPRKCVERKCWQLWVLSNKGEKTILDLSPSLCWTRRIMPQATRQKLKDELCSVMQIQNFKDKAESRISSRIPARLSTSLSADEGANPASCE